MSDPPPTHTHMIESKQTKTGTLECKENDQTLRISDHKNVNKSKNPLTPAKLENKKQDKKSIGLAGRFGRGDPIER